MCGYWMYGGLAPLGGILWIIFVIMIIWFLIRLIRGPRWHGGYRGGYWRESDRDEKDVLDILKERYARGEINKEEFEEKKADLMK